MGAVPAGGATDGGEACAGRRPADGPTTGRLWQRLFSWPPRAAAAPPAARNAAGSTVPRRRRPAPGRATACCAGRGGRARRTPPVPRVGRHRRRCGRGSPLPTAREPVPAGGGQVQHVEEVPVALGRRGQPSACRHSSTAARRAAAAQRGTTGRSGGCRAQRGLQGAAELPSFRQEEGRGATPAAGCHQAGTGVRCAPTPAVHGGVTATSGVRGHPGRPAPRPVAPECATGRDEPEEAAARPAGDHHPAG